MMARLDHVTASISRNPGTIVTKKSSVILIRAATDDGRVGVEVVHGRFNVGSARKTGL